LYIASDDTGEGHDGNACKQRRTGKINEKSTDTDGYTA
jgi:hypothetical protein